MPLTHESAPELVSGAAVPQQLRRVRVLRRFMYRGEPQAVDTEVDLPRGLAAEMLGANKAAPVSAPADAPGSTQADPGPELEAARLVRPDRQAPAKPVRGSAA